MYFFFFCFQFHIRKQCLIQGQWRFTPVFSSEFDSFSSYEEVSGPFWVDFLYAVWSRVSNFITVCILRSSTSCWKKADLSPIELSWHVFQISMDHKCKSLFTSCQFCSDLCVCPHLSTTLCWFLSRSKFWHHEVWVLPTLFFSRLFWLFCSVLLWTYNCCKKSVFKKGLLNCGVGIMVISFLLHFLNLL